MAFPRPAPAVDTLRALTTGLLVCVVLAGCQSAPYHASTLPEHLRRSAQVTQDEIQLSNLASGGADSALIGCDDLLSVTVLTGAETGAQTPHVVRVEPDGAADVPLIGPVPLAGVDIADASRVVAAAAIERGIYRQPQVTVAMHERATYRVVVLGAVKTPGAYEIPRQGCDVVSAIAAAGGLSEEAGAEIELLRQGAAAFATAPDAPPADDATERVQQAAYEPAGGPRVERIDLAQAGSGAHRNTRLTDRDVVMVHPRDKRVIHVTGLVVRPDQFELPDDQPIRVLDAIALAGGARSPVADRVLVIRQDPTNESAQPAVVELSIAKAKRSGDENLVLGPGDLVSVEQTVATTVLDSFRDFFRVTMGVSSSLTAF